MIDQFRARILEKQPLRIRGGGSKDFYGGPPTGGLLDTRGHAGIVSYEPTELVITAKSGTPLAELESALAARGQFLACEPPRFGAATVGGALAAGLSGPRRYSAGSLRDFVLGVKLMDGLGRELKFGGEVMKNVAGYDVSRLMAGSLGTLGLLLEISLKVLPLPVADATLDLELPQDRALEAMNRWAGLPLPVVATSWEDGLLRVRLAGASAAVQAARAELGGERLDDAAAAAYWEDLREQRLAFFADGAPLWRLSLPSVAPVLDLPGPVLVEWGGALRWLRAAPDAVALRAQAAEAGGHATLFRAAAREQRDAVFAPLPPALLAIHRRLKAAFDPHGILNPGRLYGEL